MSERAATSASPHAIAAIDHAQARAHRPRRARQGRRVRDSAAAAPAAHRDDAGAARLAGRRAVGSTTSTRRASAPCMVVAIDAHGDVAVRALPRFSDHMAAHSRTTGRRRRPPGAASGRGDSFASGSTRAPVPAAPGPIGADGDDRPSGVPGDREHQESGLPRDHGRHREGAGRDHELCGRRHGHAGPHRQQQESSAYDRGREQSPARLEHLWPVGIPRHREIDQAEARQHQPADREHSGQETRSEPPHRHSVHCSSPPRSEPPARPTVRSGPRRRVGDGAGARRNRPALESVDLCRSLSKER